MEKEIVVYGFVVSYREMKSALGKGLYVPTLYRYVTLVEDDQEENVMFSPYGHLLWDHPEHPGVGVWCKTEEKARDALCRMIDACSLEVLQEKHFGILQTYRYISESIRMSTNQKIESYR